MKIKRKGSAVWRGGLKDGKGAISTESGALKDYPYGFAARFEGQRGSNPEELIAAAHASCFTMALSLILGEAKLTAEHMETAAEVTLEQVEGGFAITAIHLTLKAKIPGADQATFEKLTGMAKAGCPVSKLLKAEITLDATLVNWPNTNPKRKRGPARSEFQKLTKPASSDREGQSRIPQ